ncbi:MAG: hypothetical protein JWR63_2723 [Conexibacter sp.]|nr:hypothetical protein [Conexibacter sp.]
MADVTVGLFVTLEAADGRAEDLATFLADAQALAAQEEGTVVWYALRFGETTFGIFDAFGSEDARQAHLGGAIAQGLADHPELFATPPAIEQVDVLASK